LQVSGHAEGFHISVRDQPGLPRVFRFIISTHLDTAGALAALLWKPYRLSPPCLFWVSRIQPQSA